MKRFISCIIAVLMLSSMSVVSFAEDSIAMFDKLTGILTVEDSNIANVSVGDTVTMIILKPDFSFDDLEAGSITLSESAFAIKETEVEKINNKLCYSFGNISFPSDTVIGTYELRVGIGGSYTEDASFYFVTLDALKKEISDLDKATASLMESALSDISKVFDIDISAYKDLSSKTFVNTKMADEDFSLLEGATSDDVDAVVKKIQEKLNEYVAVAALDVATDKDAAKKAVLDNAELYNIDISETSVYSMLSETSQERVLERLSEESFDDISKVAEVFDTHCVLVKFESGSYGDVETLIEKNNDILKLDLTDYNELSDTEKTYVHKKMVENSPVYKTVEEVQEAFVTAVGNAEGESGNDGETKEPSKNKGNGSSGGGSKTVALPNDITNKEETPENNEVFNDLASVSWAKEAINSLYENGIVSGRGNNAFAPNENVKRAEFIKMLTEAILTVDETADCSFVDVEKTTWYYRYVATCEKAGLVLGYDDGTLKPDSNISRQEMAVMLKRFLNYKGIILSSGNADAFKDNAQIADYAKEAAGELENAKIMTGDENKNFMPNANATRAQAAKVIFEALKLCK